MEQRLRRWSDSQHLQKQKRFVSVGEPRGTRSSPLRDTPSRPYALLPHTLTPLPSQGRWELSGTHAHAGQCPGGHTDLHCHRRLRETARYTPQSIASMGRGGDADRSASCWYLGATSICYKIRDEALVYSLLLDGRRGDVVVMSASRQRREWEFFFEEQPARGIVSGALGTNDWEFTQSFTPAKTFSISSISTPVGQLTQIFAWPRFSHHLRAEGANRWHRL